ncbi:MAG: chemotaxis protein CheB [Glaciecola sp.]
MDASQNTDSKLPSHYIGIGASAGGLEALQTLLQNLPVETGACFVIVQHLSPDFKSMMLELLSKHTNIKIENVKDGVVTERNTIYLLPPKKNVIVAQGELILTDKSPDSGLNLPIDVFFRSLAEDQQHRAIGIILSGTGSDGSRGVKALKEAGALVIAQEPDSAKFDGMPNSAINTGIVDLILRPEEMGEQLASYIDHPLVREQKDITLADNTVTQDLMSEIFNILRLKSDIDFSKYKSATISRRIERRMTIKQLTSLQDYLTLLFKDAHEVDVLGKELLIGVTRFFRDDEAFAYLKDYIIPKIVSESEEKKLVRAWVAACSSGEEAYSIAILFEEEIRKQSLDREVKVFATDVNIDAITEASAGVFSSDIESDVPAELLNRYFSKTNTNGYQVSQKIRHSVVFATHNMIIDPPFSNIDLVSCRNALIYFQPSSQKRVLSSFHFALNKHGHLFLGSSENLGDLSIHFSTINERQKIFMKTGEVKLPLSSNTDSSKANSKAANAMPSVSDLMKSYRGNNAPISGVGFVNEALISEFVAPCILLNDNFQAVHVYGDTSPYVRRLPPGRISTQIKDMVNEDISIAVSSAIQRAKYSGEEICYTGITTQGRETSSMFDLRVKYIKEHDLASAPGFYWVIFDNLDNSGAEQKKTSEKFDISEQARQRISDLELELKFNKEHLQVTVEELETTNEELQSANEELMSANEELQSTNEELQSVNEELYTVNSEYQEKIVQISQANGDLDEVLGLSKVGIVFVDDKLLIRRYTEEVKNYINLQESDIHRPLHHISKNIEYDTMLVDVATVLSTGKSVEKEISLKNKKLIRISINSYSYNDVSRTTGVAVTFLDITRARYTEKGMVVAYKELRNSINNALTELDTKPFKQSIDVLILDDSAAYLELLENQLSKIDDYHINVHMCNNVKQAFSIIEQQAIDVCICDSYLKDETALDLIDGIAGQRLNIPVIVITGAASDDLTPVLLSHGALDLIEKEDLSPKLLDDSMRYAIRRHEIDASCRAKNSDESAANSD